ncbi:MAG: VWA domain-containing protein [Anaerolineae bacterium]
MLISTNQQRPLPTFVKWLCLAAIVGFLLVLTAVNTSPSWAQDLDPQCVGVDLVVLIDESGSMLTNDPAHLRISAARNAIGSLGDNALYFCPGVQHRIAVVGFWDERDGRPDTLPYIETVTLSPTLDGDGLLQWRAERQSLYDVLPERTDSPGATDYLSAFQTANEILQRWQSDPLDGDGVPRRRGVILVADGGPCVYDLGCDIDSNTMNTDAYMRDLARYLDPNGANFPWRGEDNPDSVRIWFVGFRDTTASAAYDYLDPASSVGSVVVPVWRQITQNHGGTFEVLEAGAAGGNTRNNDVAVRVSNILEVLSEKPAIRVNCDEPFYVDPYTDRLNVQILKIGAEQGKEPEEVNVTLQYSGPLAQASLLRGEVIQGQATIEDYVADGPNERYVIANVQPGAWSLLVTNGICRRDVDVRILPLEARGRIVSPLATEAIPQFEIAPYSDPVNPARLNYILETNPPSGQDDQQIGVQPLSIIPEFPLTVTGTVKGPKGDVTSLEMSRQPDGSWQSIDPIPVPLAGQYTWEITAVAPTGSQTGTVAIRTDSGDFTVTPVDRFSFQLLSPQPGDQLPLNSVGQGQVVALPVDVVAQVLDKTGTPMSPDLVATLLGGPANLFTATIRSDLGDIVQEAPMKYNAVKNVFEASLRQPDDLQQGMLDPAGSYSIVAALNPSGYQKLKYRPEEPSQRTAVERFAVQPILVESIPNEITNSTFSGAVGCIGADPVMFDVLLQFKNALTGETLRPEAIAADPSALATLHLLEAGTEREVQAGVVETYVADQGQVLRAMFGGEDQKPGSYIVRAQLNPAALNAQYELLSEEDLVVPAQRNLSLADNPATCRTGSGILIALLIGLLAFMILNWLQRPQGTLSLIDPNTSMALKDYSLGRSPKLFFKRKQKLSASGLESFGVKKLVVKKTKPETSHRAVEMEVFDQEGTSLGTTTMESASEHLVTYEVTAKYD